MFHGKTDKKSFYQPNRGTRIRTEMSIMSEKPALRQRRRIYPSFLITDTYRPKRIPLWFGILSADVYEYGLTTGLFALYCGAWIKATVGTEDQAF